MPSLYRVRPSLRRVAVPLGAAGLLLAGVPAQAAPLTVSCGSTADLSNAINTGNSSGSGTIDLAAARTR